MSETNMIKVDEYYRSKSHKRNLIIRVLEVDGINVRYVYCTSKARYWRTRNEFKDRFIYLPGYSSPLWKVVNED